MTGLRLFDWLWRPQAPSRRSSIVDFHVHQKWSQTEWRVAYMREGNLQCSQAIWYCSNSFQPPRALRRDSQLLFFPSTKHGADRNSVWLARVDTVFASGFYFLIQSVVCFRVVFFIFFPFLVLFKFLQSWKSNFFLFFHVIVYYLNHKIKKKSIFKTR